MRFTVRRSAAFCCRFDNGVFVLWRQLAVLRGFVCVKERAKGVSGRWRLVAIEWLQGSAREPPWCNDSIF
jgi:hypothetical protein